jgi:hypothetical protein
VGCCGREHLERSTHRSKAGGDRAGHCEEDEGPDGELDCSPEGAIEGATKGTTDPVAVLSRAVEPGLAKWLVDIATTGGKGTCLDKVDGVSVDRKCVNIGRWERNVGCRLESGMTETCSVLRKGKDCSWKRTWWKI